MAKKFIPKFLTDLAARTKESEPKGDAERPIARRNKGIGFEDEYAAPYPLPVDDPLGGYTPSQTEIASSLASADEGAAHYVDNSAPAEQLQEMDAGAALRILAQQTGKRIIDLSKHGKPDHALLRLLGADQAKQLQAIPVYTREDGVVVIAIGDPSNPTIIDTLHTLLSDREIEEVIAPSKEIKDRIEQFYGMGDESLEDVVAKVETGDEPVMEATAGTSRSVHDLSDSEATSANSVPVIRLVNLLLIKAIKERASDIHIEPFPNLLRLRYRVDGVLREIPSPPRHMMTGLISRIKVMANIDISESRMPQDGRIKLLLEGREVDLRVSTAPTVHGESIVMRVLDKSMMMIGISQIGMTDEVLTRYKHHVGKPNGIVLITGPTGSGKTTTLYAAVNEIKDPGEKLITVEDPVEYEVPGIVQVNINDNVGLTFSKCLRAILRQDPDTILVGEIRDVETAQIAVQASLTGHLVLSTLHTNSATATVTRLVDMGIEPFLLTSSIEAVIGQRLTRTICQHCRVPYTPSPEELAEFGYTGDDVKDQTFFHGEGCGECGHSGYRGRLGLFELFELNDEARELILDRAGADEIQELAQRSGMVTMRQDGWLKICLGLTTFEEVLRETPRDVLFEDYKAEEEGEGEGGGEAPKAEEKKAEEPPPAETAPKELPKLDEKRMAIEGESAAHIFEIGDANKPASVPQ